MDDSEQHRLECEARYVLSKPRPWRKQYLAKIGKRRGKEALKTLKDAIMVEYEKDKARYQ